MSRKFVLRGLLVSLVAAILIVCVVALFVIKSREQVRRRQFNDLLAALRSGELSAGASAIDCVRIGGKPASAVLRQDEQGAEYCMFAFEAHNQLIVLYEFDGAMFSAHHLTWWNASREQWFFHDSERFGHYVNLAKTAGD